MSYLHRPRQEALPPSARCRPSTARLPDTRTRARRTGRPASWMSGDHLWSYQQPTIPILGPTRRRRRVRLCTGRQMGSRPPVFLQSDDVMNLVLISGLRAMPPLPWRCRSWHEPPNKGWGVIGDIIYTYTVAPRAVCWAPYTFHCRPRTHRMVWIETWTGRFIIGRKRGPGSGCCSSWSTCLVA